MPGNADEFVHLFLTYLAAQLVGSRSSTCDYALSDTDDTLFLNMWKHEEL